MCIRDSIRVELRRNLHDIQRELRIPTLFVTHDQEEAFELADRIAVMANGRLVEEGAPKELYLRPRTEFVAVFLGGANLWMGQTSPAGVRLGTLELPLDASVRGDEGERPIQVLVRPEDVSVATRREDLLGSLLGEAEVVESSFVGIAERIRLRMPALDGVRVLHPPPPFGASHLAIDASRSQPVATRAPLAAGDRVWVGVRRLHALPQPGLSIVAVGDERLIAGAQELAQLAQARFRSVADPEALTNLLQGSESADLVVTRAGGRDFAERSEAWLERAGEAHLLFLPTPVRLPPTRFLISVAVGEPGKDDIAFSGQLASLLGSKATLFTVLAEGANEADLQWAERFLDGGRRTLERAGVPSEQAIGRGDWIDGVRARLEAGHDLLALGAPLEGEDGRIRWGRHASRLLDDLGSRPLLVIRSRVAERPRRTA